MSAGTKIERKQEAVIAALLTEPTHALAAAKAGISEATLQRWLRRPDFQEVYQAARRGVLDALVGRLQQAGGEAVDALRRNLTNGQPALEIRAALAILDQTFKAADFLDLEERLQALEAQQAADPEADGPDLPPG